MAICLSDLRRLGTVIAGEGGNTAGTTIGETKGTGTRVREGGGTDKVEGRGTGRGDEGASLAGS